MDEGLFKHSSEVFEDSRANFSNGIVFICLTVFVAVICKEVTKKVPLPFQALVFLYGGLIGYLNEKKILSFIAIIHYLANFNADLLMHLFMPSIIYEAAFSLEPNRFNMSKRSCFLLAIPGLIFCTLGSAAFAKIFFVSYEWSWTVAIMYGAMMSTSAPYTILSHLRKNGFKANLIVVLTAEAIINNVLATVIFNGMIERYYYDTSVSWTLVGILYDVSVCLVVSYIFSLGAIMLLRKIQLDEDIEVTTTICIVYINYYVNEITLKSSGMLSVAALGLSISNYKSNARYEDEEGTTVHQFWETLSFWASTFIYTIVGINVMESLHTSFLNSNDGVYTFSGYVISTILRFFMIRVSSYFMVSSESELDLKDTFVLCWGGLRGVVAVGMVHYSTQILAQNINILKSVSGAIFCTLVINGSTIKILLDLLGYGQKTEKNIERMQKAVTELRESVTISEKIIRINKHFMDVDWMWVHSVTFFQNPYEMPQDIYAVRQNSGEGIETAPNETAEREHAEESRIRVLNSLESSIYSQHEHFGITRRTLHILMTSLEEAANEPGKYFSSEELIKKYTSTWRMIRFMRTQINKLLPFFNIRDYAAKKELFLKTRGKVFPPGFQLTFIDNYFSEHSSILIYCILLLNVGTVALGIGVLMKWNDESFLAKGHQILGIEVLNCVFSIIYVVDAAFGIVVLGFSEYFRNHGNKIDFSVTLIAVSEMIFFIVLLSKYPVKEFPDFEFGIVLTLVVLNSLKLVRFLRMTGVMLLMNVLNEVSWAIFNAYDLAMGFIYANKEIVQTASQIIQYEPNAELARFTAEKNIGEMMCYKDDLEREFPDVLNAWTTHRAALYVLKDMKNVTEEMEESYMIDELDFELLSEDIVLKIRHIFNEPKFMSCSKGISDILKKISWIKNEKMMRFILDNSRVVNFSSCEIVQKDQKQQHLNIISSGIIEVSGCSYFEQSRILPNTDSLEYFRREGHFTDHLISPDAIGILGYLLGEKCVTTATCYKDCQVIQVSYETLYEAEKMFGDFSYEMWRPIAIKIAKVILSKQEMYEYWTNERLKTHLQGGTFPDLKGRDCFIITDETITDMVLIQGRVQDDETKENYIGPSYIPSSVRNMILLDDISSRQRIVMILFRQKSYNAPTLMGWIDPSQIKLRGLCSVHGLRRASENLEQLLARQKNHPSFGNKIRGRFLTVDSREDVIEAPELP